ncbi:hypothetical protein AHF37_10615 [Paragonimus kellicotti]|nr:hypothetical protein AHF37_10615 [Paragonimus kellicotti]
MPWIGDSTILIDRFDARTNLENWDSQTEEAPKMTPVERIEERLCMYERYRLSYTMTLQAISETCYPDVVTTCIYLGILIPFNVMHIYGRFQLFFFLAVTEAMALKQIELDEKYGDLDKKRKEEEEVGKKMPWIGDSTILIDRFDARTNLENWDSQTEEAPKMTPVERIEERLCMYERYRCIIHNDFAGVTEAMALKTIELDEKYGDLDKKRKEEEEVGKKSQEPKAAIGFTYEDSNQASGGVGMNTTVTTTTLASGPPTGTGDDSSDSEEEADSDMDIDVELDLATLGLEGRRQLAKSAATFGLHPTDFVQLLSADQQLETELRLAKALEEEKLQLAVSALTFRFAQLHSSSCLLPSA